MARIPIQDPSDGGGEITFQAADAAGDIFANDGSSIIRVLGPSAEFALLVTSVDCAWGAHPPYRIIVPAGSEWGESQTLSVRRFNNNLGDATITYDPSAVGIQIAVTRVISILSTEDQCP